MLPLCAFFVCTVYMRGEAAKVIAKERIEEYCKKENIPLVAMSKPVISKRYTPEWIFDYTSETNPRHEVRFLIDVFGHVKTHRLIEAEWSGP